MTATFGELLRIRSAPGFMERLAAVRTSTVRRIPDLKDALLANALDAKRADQWVWMQRYERMTRTRFLNVAPGDRMAREEEE